MIFLEEKFFHKKIFFRKNVRNGNFFQKSRFFSFFEHISLKKTDKPYLDHKFFLLSYYYYTPKCKKTKNQDHCGFLWRIFFLNFTKPKNLHDNYHLFVKKQHSFSIGPMVKSFCSFLALGVLSKTTKGFGHNLF